MLDGWTYEVDWDGIGWNLDPNNISSSFYDLMEQEIVPQYYERGEDNIPNEWIKKMRLSIALAEKFNSKVMLEEYEDKLYS